MVGNEITFWTGITLACRSLRCLMRIFMVMLHANIYLPKGTVNNIKWVCQPKIEMSAFRSNRKMFACHNSILV